MKFNNNINITENQKNKFIFNTKSKWFNNYFDELIQKKNATPGPGQYE